jgi:hypothetical protein
VLMSTHDFGGLGPWAGRVTWPLRQAARQPEVALAGGGEVGLGHRGEGRIALDQHRAPTGGEGRDAGRAPASEGVEYKSAGRGVEPKELRHQLDRLGARVRARVPDLRHVEHVLQATRDRVHGEHTRGPSAGGIRTVRLVAIETVGEHAAPGPMERVRAGGLLPIANVTPRNPRLVNARDERRTRDVRNDDRGKRRARLCRSARPTCRVEPDAVPLDREARVLDCHGEPVPGPVVADEDELAAGP